MRPDTSWILTSSGRQFWPLVPRVEDVCIEDIAHALSQMCRFAGHCREFYSVAQHSVIVSEIVHPRYALEGLLHDAPEAYLCDIPRPLKRQPEFDFYHEAENRLMWTIRQAFSMPSSIEPGGVNAADEKMLFTERRDLMPPGHWIIDETACYPWHIDPWPAARAKQRFLERFEELR